MDGWAKKRFGQYFSGPKVSDLLISLAPPGPRDDVVDPMAGCGDMLAAAIRAGASPERVRGVEIDPSAAELCRADLPGVKIVVGDAFNAAVLGDLGRDPFDLVVTNPPYVRYQSLRSPRAEDDLRLLADDLSLRAKRLTRPKARHDVHQARRTVAIPNAPDAAEVRLGLRNHVLFAANHLSAEERDFLSGLVRGYSGLADLAVPCWLLCAAMVKPGGTLSMVAPESWLGRDWALAVKYALLGLFDLQFVVEDAGAAWFPEAQVRVNLVVARRRSGLHPGPLLERDSLYKRVRLAAGLIGDGSLVGRLTFAGLGGVEAWKALTASDKAEAGEGFELRLARMGELIGDHGASASRARRLAVSGPGAGQPAGPTLPGETFEALGRPAGSLTLSSLADWGFSVGQGLRTGANKFFYAERLGCRQDLELLEVHPDLGGGIIEAPRDWALPALRWQTDVSGVFLAAKDRLSHRLLHLGPAGAAGGAVPESFAAHLARVGSVPVPGPGGREVLLPTLAAVKTNEGAAGLPGGPRRRWYMLPPLARRHRPELCVARINHKRVCCLMVEAGVVVDANFSTLWRENPGGDDEAAFAMLALLNSVWAQALLEPVAPILGGGALKVEAARLAAIALPQPERGLKSRLAALGRALVKLPAGPEADGLMSEAGRLAVEAVLGSARASAGRFEGLKRLVNDRVAARLPGGFGNDEFRRCGNN